MLHLGCSPCPRSKQPRHSHSCLDLAPQVLDFDSRESYEVYQACSRAHGDALALEDWAQGERHALVQVRTGLVRVAHIRRGRWYGSLCGCVGV